MQITLDFTLGAIKELLVFTEQRCQISLRTREFIGIIYKEVQTFCDRDKSPKEVCNIIQKRGRTYTNETM